MGIDSLHSYMELCTKQKKRKICNQVIKTLLLCVIQQASISPMIHCQNAKLQTVNLQNILFDSHSEVYDFSRYFAVSNKCVDNILNIL